MNKSKKKKLHKDWSGNRERLKNVCCMMNEMETETQSSSPYILHKKMVNEMPVR